MRSIKRFTINANVGSAEVSIATDRSSTNDACQEQTKTNWVAVTILDERHAAWVVRNVKKSEDIKDDTVDELARRYQFIVQASSKTEAVRQALQHAVDEQLGQPALADIAAKFARHLLTNAKPKKGRPADKAFRDGLYD
jgi:antitoxin VapB